MRDIIKRFVRRTISHACFWICENLDGYGEGSTTRTKLSAGSAVAAVEALDIQRALDTDVLPFQIKATLVAFSREDWREVLATARDERQFMEDELRCPEWAHLRRTTSD